VKLAIFHPAARAAIRLFPEEIRRELGKAIFDLQNGAVLAMPLSRSMPSVHAGVSELRIRDRSGIYRVFLLSPVISRRSRVSWIYEKDPYDPETRDGSREKAFEGVAG